jgi:hypothetical protein
MAEHNYIVLIRPKLECNLLPHVAVFDGSNGVKSISVKVHEFEVAMRNFKLSVRLDTAVAKKVYPYNNAIALQWEGGESSILDQVDSFTFEEPRPHSVEPIDEINVRIYMVDHTVDVISVHGKQVKEWADINQLNQIFSLSRPTMERDILERTFAILPRISNKVD